VLTTTVTGLITATHVNALDVRVYDCDIHNWYPNSYVDGIRGHHLTVERCEIKWTVDGFGTFNNDGSTYLTDNHLKGNYVHDLCFVYPDIATPSHTDGTHNDCWQVQGGSGNESVGNWFDGHVADDGVTTPAGILVGTQIADSSGYKRANLTANAALQVTPNVPSGTTTAPVQSDKDWFNGGDAGQVNIADWTANYGSFTNGRYNRDANLGSTWTLNVNAPRSGTQSGNTYEDNGAAITLH
jgi:hypothetical protein